MRLNVLKTAALHRAPRHLYCTNPLLPRKEMSSSASNSSASSSDKVYFSKLDVTDSVFLRTEHVIGIVNLKPIVPCRESVTSSSETGDWTSLNSLCSHSTPDVLLIPPNPSITRLSSLPSTSIGPFFQTVQHVVSTLQRVTGSTSCTVAIQDGPEAGQSVNHLHVHILPRKVGDFEENDEVYARLDEFGFEAGSKKRKDGSANASANASGVLAPDAEEERKPRSKEEMKAEAEWLRSVFDQ